MNGQSHTPPTRCTASGSSCRLLQLELPDPRPVWAALDAAGLRRFTGELTLHLQPIVRVWFVAGEVYLAERETDPPLVDRLLGAAVLTPEQLAAGSVRAGGAVHLGRLFERVPAIDRDLVELTVELQTASVLGEIADRVVPAIDVASHRHHPSGIQRWITRPAGERPEPLRDQVAADVGVGTAQGSWGSLDHAASRLPDPPAGCAPATMPPPPAPVVAAPALHDTSPSPGAADLTRVIREVAFENPVGLLADDALDVSDEVRAAVRQALAEIEAATRPAVTDGLSVARLLAAAPSEDPAPIAPQRSAVAAVRVASALG